LALARSSSAVLLLDSFTWFWSSLLAESLGDAARAQKVQKNRSEIIAKASKA
jgi:PIN domain nuclease of toxin-antitoxin system